MKFASHVLLQFRRNKTISDNIIFKLRTSCSNGKGTPRKLATATQTQFPKKIADFKQANGFQISKRTLKKLTFE
jgi:hypothetical protein